MRAVLPWQIQLLMVLLSFFCTFYFRRRILEFLNRKEITVRNYAGKRVVTGGGLLLLFPCVIGAAPALLVAPLPEVVLYWMVCLSLALAGLLDDLLGDSGAKGLMGHGRAFQQGAFTTGAMKAFVGLLAGGAIALSQYRTQMELLLDVLVFALWVNLMNLLDLRPGRAVKGLLICAMPLILAGGLSWVWLLLPLFGSLAVYLRGELKEQYMLGDAGAGLLGGLLGFFALRTLSFWGRTTALVLLLLIHIYAETASISKIIASNRVLRALDGLGRRFKEEGAE